MFKIEQQQQAVLQHSLLLLLFRLSPHIFSEKNMVILFYDMKAFKNKSLDILISEKVLVNKGIMKKVFRTMNHLFNRFSRLKGGTNENCITGTSFFR